MSSDTRAENQDTKIKSHVMFVVYATVACLLALAIYFHIFHLRASVEIELEVSQVSDFKIYWAGVAQPFSERRMAKVSVRPGQKKYSFYLEDLAHIHRLRIDTHDYKGEATFQSITIRQEGYDTQTIDTATGFSALTPLGQIEDFFSDNEGLVVRSSGLDPNFELVLSPQYRGLDNIWLPAKLVVICLVVIGICWFGRPLGTELKFVPVLVFGIWLLIVVMSVVSKENVHPDEYVHLAAVQYYSDHWLPPDLLDPSIDHTYSVYGVSRLSSLEIYYLIAGKAKKIFDIKELPNHISLRLLNVLLWGAIFFYTVKSLSARIMALPMLVTPQVWYLFSYCNSDGFALFVAFLGGCQIVDRNSLLYRYLRGDNLSSRVCGVLLLGLLLATLLLLKKNYFPFIAFICLCLLFKVFFTEEFYWDRRDVIVRVIAFTLLGSALFGLRLGIDYYVYGMDKAAQIEVIKNIKGNPQFRPDAPLEETNHFLFKRAKGVTWQEMITKYRWLDFSINNSLGTFGYGNITGPFVYYQVMRWAGMLFLALLIGSAIIRGGLAGGGVAAAACAFAATIVVASFHHSWVHDFQPQGRYLFPILPVLGIVYGWNYEIVHRQLVTLLVSFMFLFSVYFFIFHGLRFTT